MHDIRFIRDDPQAFDRGLEKRGLASPREALLALDDARKAVIGRLQTMQERRNAASREIGQAKAQKDEARAQGLMAEVAGIKTGIPEAEAELKRIETELRDLLAGIPNIPAEDVPVGSDEHGNVQRSAWPERANLRTGPQHFEIGESLGLMDFEAAAKLSGSRFTVLKGGLARLERALAQFMLDLHTGEHGYTEVSPPLLVRDEAMFGTAQLPKFREDQFAAVRTLTVEEAEDVSVDEAFRKQGGFSDEVSFNRVYQIAEALKYELVNTGEKRWLIPTAEVPLTNLVAGEILAEKELPLRFTAGTHCFRAEAGAAGRDTRGMIRQHQFFKVELVSITAPEKSVEEQERMLGCAEEVLRRLELPYRVMTLCTGDMGFASQKTYDIEVWLPGQNTYREISSCSNCGAFQARRMNARFRPEGGKGTEFVHTLNGSGVAVGRALVAVLETYVEQDGSVTVPSALVPYMGGMTRIERAS